MSGCNTSNLSVSRVSRMVNECEEKCDLNGLSETFSDNMKTCSNYETNFIGEIDYENLCNTVRELVGEENFRKIISTD